MLFILLIPFRLYTKPQTKTLYKHEPYPIHICIAQVLTILNHQISDQ